MVTTDQKRRLIAHYKAMNVQQVARLQKFCRDQEEEIEVMLRKKLDAIPKMHQRVRLNEVLAVERRKQPNAKTLLTDVQREKRIKKSWTGWIWIF